MESTVTYSLKHWSIKITNIAFASGQNGITYCIDNDLILRIFKLLLNCWCKLMFWYMKWLLSSRPGVRRDSRKSKVFFYYTTLKLSSVFTLPAAIPSTNHICLIFSGCKAIETEEFINCSNAKAAERSINSVPLNNSPNDVYRNPMIAYRN